MNLKIRLFSILLFLSCSLLAQEVKQTYKNPVIAGDFPDPTVIRVGDTYYAAGTTSDFAPSYPIYQSKDLVNWEQIGSVFNEPPAWIVGDCWAPELYYNDGTFFVYYTARKKSDKISCIGVATTKDISKGFKDHGILIDWDKEAIDAYVFKDVDGKQYISWKAYGLDNRPIEMLSQGLSADGLSLVGEVFSMSDPKSGWIEKGDEGQCIVKRDDYYYLFYSVGGCCDNRCDYRVEVARSKSIKGEWEQYAQNPIMEGGELWRCSGHGTLVQSPDDRYFFLYHAYHAYDFEYVGRQALLDELLWSKETGWPYFKYGRNPSTQAEVPFVGTVQKRNNIFNDNFADAAKDKIWLWDMYLGKPEIIKDNGTLTLSTTSTDATFRGINLHTGNYVMETAVENEGDNFKGLSVYGDRNNQLLWGVDNGKITLYKMKDGKREILFSEKTTASKIYLKVQAINARTLKFYYSTNQKDWIQCSTTTGDYVDGSFLPRWGRGLRAGLYVDKKTDNRGKFSYFSFDSKY